MSEFLRKHKESILIILSILIAISLLFIIFYSNPSSFNPITPEEEEETGNYIQNPYFIIPFILWAFSLVSIFLVIFFTRSKEYMMGSSSGKYKNKKDILESFLSIVIKTNSKVTDKNYTLHILKKIKKGKSSFKHIEILNVNPYFKVDEAIEKVSEDKFKSLIQIILDGFSSSGDEDDPFLTLLKSEIGHDLSKALESYGIVIWD